MRLLVADKDGKIVAQVAEKELKAGNIEWQKKGVEPKTEGK
jgi:hypothetical protein